MFASSPANISPLINRSSLVLRCELKRSAGEIRRRDVQAEVGFVMELDHADELLNLDRANAIRCGVPLALNRDRGAILIAAGDVDRKVSGAACLADAAEAKLAKNRPHRLLELVRAKSKEILQFLPRNTLLPTKRSPPVPPATQASHHPIMPRSSRRRRASNHGTSAPGFPSFRTVEARVPRLLMTRDGADKPLRH